ncbi:MAG TPA: YaeQ family protein [Myxococcota bacterium]
MAQQATVYRFPVQLSHVDRGVYENIDVRMARHPSETERFLLARLLAYCLYLEEGLAFSKGGLSSPDEPALSIHTLDGRLTAIIEVGSPSAERLHKATKASPRVVVVTHNDPALLVADVAAKKVHKASEIECIALDPAFLDALAAHIGDRGTALELTVTDGNVYVVVAGSTIETTLRKVALAG